MKKSFEGFFVGVFVILVILVIAIKLADFEVSENSYQQILDIYDNCPWTHTVIKEAMKDSEITKSEEESILRTVDYPVIDKPSKTVLKAKIILDKVVKDIPVTQPN